jgi:hypothetical protein
MSQPGEPEPIWDALQDVVALVTAYRGGDDEGQRVLLEHCNKPLVTSIAIHLLAQVATENDASYAGLLAWAFMSVDRGT